MAFEYPFSFIPGALAKAAQVNANFNAIKTALTGGLKFENFAAGALASIADFYQGANVALAGFVYADLLPSGAAGEVLNLSTKSKVHFSFSARAISNNVFLKILVDGAEYPVSAGNASSGNVAFGQQALTLAAGEHKIRLMATSSAGEASGGRVIATVVPVE